MHTELRITRKQFRKALADLEADRREAKAIVDAVNSTRICDVTEITFDSFIEARDTLMRLAAEAAALRVRYATDRNFNRCMVRRRYRKLSSSQKTMIYRNVMATAARDGHVYGMEG
jgi:hypothetical protein